MATNDSYKLSSRYYDLIYSFKDYEAESNYLVDVVKEHCGVENITLLDVACGTGCHLEYLKRSFDVEGVDLNPDFVHLAKARNPEIEIHQGDMITLDLGKRYTVITCLFSAIGYMTTPELLRAALNSMASHLQPNGLLVIEPWFSPEAWRGNTVHSIHIDQPELKITRMNTSLTNGRNSVMEMHYLVGTPEKTEHFVELHKMGMYTTEEMLGMVADVGLQPIHDPVGPTGRELIMGRKVT